MLPFIYWPAIAALWWANQLPPGTIKPYTDAYIKATRRQKLKEMIARDGPCSSSLREDIRRDNGCPDV